LAGAVIMMATSDELPETSQGCQSLDIRALLVKPIKRSELLEAILVTLGLTGDIAEVGPAAADLGRSIGPLRILVAEDSLVNQKVILGTLQTRGHQVTLADNGRTALAKFQRQPFDLVLMDVQMPEMDGLEAAAAIRDLEGSAVKRTPIVALTAHAMKGDRERFLAAGMDEYVAKPVRADELFEVIASLLGPDTRAGDRRTGGIEQPAAQSPSQPAGQSAADASS
jgi:CheY-like chemotaxis protein